MNRLILFTRYPEPGKTKTRLIPGIGAEKAAALQKKLTEETLGRVRYQHWVKDWNSGNSPCYEVEVQYDGASEQDFKRWLGPHANFRKQCEGNLGSRLVGAFAAAFDDGCDSVLAIGIDAPYLTMRQIERAYRALCNHDTVLGPADDGGYYLIGMNASHPELFENMNWGTEKVLAQTVEAIETKKLSSYHLEELSDIDHPEDIKLLDRISVIIPTFNEEGQLTENFSNLDLEGCEVIVSDGGSTDNTIEEAIGLGFRVIRASELGQKTTRGKQLNTAAAYATGNKLLFLHADTQPPADFQKIIRESLEKEGVAAGCFGLEIASDCRAHHCISNAANVRARYFNVVYGDQGIFVKSDTFRKVGGFPGLPIMEDLEFVKRIRRIGTFVKRSETVVTSPRRWNKKGSIATTLMNQAVFAGYVLGVPADRLARWYRS